MELTKRDRSRLAGVHPDLCVVIETAAVKTRCSWFIAETLRTLERQKELLLQKPPPTKTIESRHIPRSVLYRGDMQLLGHAVDIVLRKPNGKANWNVPDYYPLAAEILAVASRFRVPMKWGGHFVNSKGQPFVDAVHFELHEDAYPLPPLDLSPQKDH